MSATGTFNLTPDPRVLIVLTQTPLRPLDALSELIDNSLDSFRHAEIEGVKVESPQIDIRIPTITDLRSGATILITDTGPGMTAERLEMAVRAGYSNKSTFKDLGLFGMGLNIATGKLGQLTEIRTKPLHGKEVVVRLDLAEIQRTKSYSVPYSENEGTSEKRHYTQIEIKRWWPEGHPNAGFIRSLCQMSKDSVRKDIGRRYATILRHNKVRIFVNGTPCVAYEACRWGDQRFVEHREHGPIPAYYEFKNRLLHSSTRCSACGVEANPNDACEMCGGTEFETIDERISGWVGIQRYDDATEFGIDLIRNGRAIVVQEQDAFFSFVDDLNKRYKEYPDGTYGRIIGEVSLDYVPVEFMKRDFQRTAAEWRRAVDFLRGTTPLAPKSVGEGSSNSSPVFMLFQGYRKVRNGGRRELYMCEWDATARVPGPRRIDRGVEAEFRRKFEQREAGYYDDEQWYRQVEAGETPPVPELILCPDCDAQNIVEAEECVQCGFILNGKSCVNCAVPIPRSAMVCPGCGESQIVVVREPWKCAVCGLHNDTDAAQCVRCSSIPGEPALLSLERLLADSARTDRLSRSGVTTPLPGGRYTQPINVVVYETKTGIRPAWDSEAIPLVTKPSLDELKIFIDLNHPMLKSLARPEHLVATEIASHFSTRYSEYKLSGESFSIAAIAWQIIKTQWGDDLIDEPESIKTDIRELFGRVRQGLRYTADDIAEEIYNNLTAEQQTALLRNLHSQDRPIDAMVEMVKSGEILSYIDDEAVITVFRTYPERFFDNKVWKEPYAEIAGVFPAMLREHQLALRANYLNCLEDVLAFLRYSNPESVIAARARTSCELLYRKLL